MHIGERLKGIRSTFLGLDPGMMKLFYRHVYSFEPNSLDSRIDQICGGKQPFHFFQVGGNDGFINDPIFKFVKRYSWKGIIVEPQADVFKDRLRRTYRNEKNVILENVAIAEKPGVKKLYKIAISDSRWASGLASFDKKSVEEQIKSERVRDKARKENVRIPNTPDNWITFEDVQCSSIEALMQEHGFDSLDLVQIDTEGYDFEIIRTIDFEKISPMAICFENLHMDEATKAHCFSLLENHGYNLEHYAGDSIAFKEV